MPLKAELHAHTRDDPHDAIPHSAVELIDRAAALGYGALAITLHDRQLDIRDLAGYAADRQVLLLRGIERTIVGKHVLLINFDHRAEEVDSFPALDALRRATPGGLVIAPHPFYPAPQSLGRHLRAHPELFDAVEFNAFYTSATGLFNRAAVRWAQANGKAVVANADVHRLPQLGRTYSLVDVGAEPTADAFCAAIKAGRVRIETTPLSTLAAARQLLTLLWSDVVPTPRHP